jgi:hypothetical protein
MLEEIEKFEICFRANAPKRSSLFAEFFFPDMQETVRLRCPGYEGLDRNVASTECHVISALYRVPHH